MIKYTPANQLVFSEFSSPFSNSLDPNNKWVKLAKIIPWDALASVYSKKLNSKAGRKSIDVRMVIAALIVKHSFALDDRGTVDMISENIYLQYFCGLKSFQTKKPFHPTVFVDIRKRMGAIEFDSWNEEIIKKADNFLPKKKQQITGTKKKIGNLKIDASVADQNISYPTDAGLLSKARTKSEKLIDLLYLQTDLTKKPRTYRREAKKIYLSFSKKRKKNKKEIRKYIRKQLNYLKRNIAHIEKLLDSLESQSTVIEQVGMFKDFERKKEFPLNKQDQKIYWVIQEIYRQQKEMYDTRKHSTANRIVNIQQPYVRPIVRGKDSHSVEFGAKISASENQGMTRVEHISWDNFNESIDMELQLEMYKKTYGHYPELLLADRLYLNRKNRKWLNEKEIRIVGKPLGRPKAIKLTAYEKSKRKREQNQRNLIEGKFGQAKNKYGLKKIRAKTKATSESWISAIFFVLNIVNLLKIADKSAIFLCLIEKSIFLAKNVTKKASAMCRKLNFNLEPENLKVFDENIFLNLKINS